MRVVLAVAIGLASGTAFAQGTKAPEPKVGLIELVFYGDSQQMKPRMVADDLTQDALKAAQEPAEKLHYYDMKARLKAAEAFMPDRAKELAIAKQMHLGNWECAVPGRFSTCVNLGAQPAAQR